MSHAHLSRVLSTAAAAAIVALAAACPDSDRVAGPGASVAIGTWGGDNAGVIVNDTIAHVHIGCTFGDIPGPVILNGDGRFAASGTYVLRAYPVYIGPTLPAQFTGTVEGKTLTITATVNDTVAKTTVIKGPVTVTLGTDPRLGPCPICTVPGARMRMR